MDQNISADVRPNTVLDTYIFRFILDALFNSDKNSLYNYFWLLSWCARITLVRRSTPRLSRSATNQRTGVPTSSPLTATGMEDFFISAIS